MREASLYKKMPSQAVSCFLCQRRCYLKAGEKGFCHVRQNIDGKLMSLNYGKCVSYCNDPIEKMPFYHFMPGSQVFSFAAAGCNFRCEHCQNWEISQPSEISGQEISPARLVELATAADSWDALLAACRERGDEITFAATLAARKRAHQSR